MSGGFFSGEGIEYKVKEDDRKRDGEQRAANTISSVRYCMDYPGRIKLPVLLYQQERRTEETGPVLACLGNRGIIRGIRLLRNASAKLHVDRHTRHLFYLLSEC